MHLYSSRWKRGFDILLVIQVAKAYFALLECLCHSHISFILSQDTSTFTHIVQSIEAGLKSLEVCASLGFPWCDCASDLKYFDFYQVSVSSQCASAIDNLVAYHFTHSVSATPDTPPPQAAQALAHHMAERPNLFPDILKLLFEIVLFEDCANQWSLSRPMLRLILVNEQIFNDLKQQIVSTQPVDRQQVKDLMVWYLVLLMPVAYCDDICIWTSHIVVLFSWLSA